MALSNIFNEPRRELTETFVGILIVSAVLLIDYAFASLLENYTGLPWSAGMILGILSIIVVIGFLIVIHAIGEEICDLLQRHNIHLRPRSMPDADKISGRCTHRWNAVDR